MQQREVLLIRPDRVAPVEPAQLVRLKHHHREACFEQVETGNIKSSGNELRCVPAVRST
jgi:hypothetical protein